MIAKALLVEKVHFYWVSGLSALIGTKSRGTKSVKTNGTITCVRHRIATFWSKLSSLEFTSDLYHMFLEIPQMLQSLTPSTFHAPVVSDRPRWATLTCPPAFGCRGNVLNQRGTHDGARVCIRAASARLRRRDCSRVSRRLENLLKGYELCNLFKQLNQSNRKVNGWGCADYEDNDRTDR